MTTGAATDLEGAYAAAVSLVRDAPRLLVTTHENPDGDAIGSLVAAARSLRLGGWDVVAFLAGTTQLPFVPPTGFTAFGRNYRTPANLILLNRGLKGKVDVYRGLQHSSPTAGAFTAAITELTQALGGA